MWMLRGARAALLLVCVVWPLAATPVPAQEIDLERLTPGCGGSPEDFWIARQIDDLRRPAIQWRGVENESCLVSQVRWRDGVASARISSRGEAAGFALRYLDADHYLGVYLDQRAGLAIVKEWVGEEGRLLASVAFDPPRRVRAPRVTAAAAGGRVVVFVEGRRILEADGATPREGLVALLAAPLSEAEVDEAATVELAGPQAAFVEPLALPPTTVGAALDTALACHPIVQPEGEGPGCRFTIEEPSLPPGVGFSSSGRLIGSPRRPGLLDLRLTVTPAAAGRVTRQAIRLQVDGVTWPRFPHDRASGQARTIAVTYTPDDIGPTVTWNKLGRPDDVLFRLHRDHPMLRMTLTVCPENRYVKPPAPEVRARAEQVWRDIANDPNLEWLELGGHGYAHSPDGDVDLHHDEFSVTQAGCNVDHSGFGERAYCERRFAQARAALRRAGIPDDALAVMRFPGVEDSPEALRAAAHDGYVAVLGSRHLDQPGRAWWTALPGGGEILELQNLAYQRAFARSDELERGLADGTIPATAVKESAAFQSALDEGRRLVPRLEAQGGIVSLFDHWWESFEPFGATTPRYLLLDAWLRELPRDRVWWPSARELAAWLQLRRFGRTTVQYRHERIEVRIDPPEPWRPPEKGLEASLIVHVPGHGRITEVLAEGRPLPAARWKTAAGGVLLNLTIRDRTHITLLTPREPGR